MVGQKARGGSAGGHLTQPRQAARRVACPTPTGEPPCAPAAQSCRPTAPCLRPARAGHLVDVQIVDRDGGGALPLYLARGRRYVTGVPGHRHSVRLSNRSGVRVMTVLSVDGVNAITGRRPARTNRAMCWVPTRAPRFRLARDMSAVAAFEFTALSDSAARNRPVRQRRRDRCGSVPRTSTPARPTRRRDRRRGPARAVPRRPVRLCHCSTRPGLGRSCARRRASRRQGPGRGVARHRPRRARGQLRQLATRPSSATARGRTRSCRSGTTAWAAAGARVVPRPRPLPPSEPQAFPAGFVADPPQD